jgi:hypothetical protein
MSATKKRKITKDSSIKSYINQNLPVCNIPLNYTKIMKDYKFDTYDITIKDIIYHSVGGDCWGIEAKYSCSDSPTIVEYNSYNLEYNETEHIFGTTHPQYIPSMAKTKGNQFRDYVMQCPDKFLESVDWVTIYSWGECASMMKVTKLSDGTFKKEFFGSTEYVQKYPTDAK